MVFRLSVCLGVSSTILVSLTIAGFMIGLSVMNRIAIHLLILSALCASMDAILVLYQAHMGRNSRRPRLRSAFRSYLQG